MEKLFEQEEKDAQEAQPMTADRLAERFHETYERLAPDFGYRTREASAKPWADVPEQNKALMIAVCRELLGAGVPVGGAPGKGPSLTLLTAARLLWAWTESEKRLPVAFSNARCRDMVKLLADSGVPADLQLRIKLARAEERLRAQTASAKLSDDTYKKLVIARHKARAQATKRGQHLNMLNAKLHGWNVAMLEAIKMTGITRLGLDLDAGLGPGLDDSDYGPGEFFPRHLVGVVARLLNERDTALTKVRQLKKDLKTALEGMATLQRTWQEEVDRDNATVAELRTVLGALPHETALSAAKRVMQAPAQVVPSTDLALLEDAGNTLRQLSQEVLNSASARKEISRLDLVLSDVRSILGARGEGIKEAASRVVKERDEALLAVSKVSADKHT